MLRSSIKTRSPARHMEHCAPAERQIEEPQYDRGRRQKTAEETHLKRPPPGSPLGMASEHQPTFLAFLEIRIQLQVHVGLFFRTESEQVVTFLTFHEH